MVIETFKEKFSWSLFNEYGGMPSSHTAFVAGLLATVALYQGINNTVFSVALIFAIITVRDATGFRRHLGKHAQVLNKIVKELPDSKQSDFPILPERLGHTPFQVLVGAIIGALIPILWFLHNIL